MKFKRGNTQRVIAFIPLCLCSFILSAQVISEKRIEFEQGDGYESYSLTPFGEMGFLFYAHEENGTKWKIERYNPKLNAEQSKTIDVPKTIVCLRNLNLQLIFHYCSVIEKVLIFYIKLMRPI